MAKKINIHETNSYLMLVSKLSNCGRKVASYRRFLFLLEKLKLQFDTNAKAMFEIILTMFEIYIYIFKKKIGSKVYQIPLYLKKRQRFQKGLANFAKVIDNRKERKLKDRMLNEIIDIYFCKGSTIGLRNNIYLLAAEQKNNLRFMRTRFERKFFDYNIINKI